MKIYDAYSPVERLEWHHFLLVPIVPLVPMDHWNINCPVPSQTTCENNLSPLKVSSKVKSIFRWLSKAHQELSFKKIPGKMFFCANLWSAKSFFYANYFNWSGFGIHLITTASLIKRCKFIRIYSLGPKDLVSVVHIRESTYYWGSFFNKIYENFVGTLDTVHNIEVSVLEKCLYWEVRL